jgi:alpha-L-fucosidase
VINTPWGKDTFGMIVTAFRAEGLRVGAYVNPAQIQSDLYWAPDHLRALGPVGPTYDPVANPGIWKKYTAYYRSLLAELAANYAPDLFWIDINQQWDVEIDKVKPESLKANPEAVMTLRDNWMDSQFIFSDYIETDDQSDSVGNEIADSFQAALSSTFEVPTVLATSGQWSYDPHTDYKSAAEILGSLSSVTAKGGNLLVNVGPGPTGLWDSKAVAVLEKMASWMAVNAEAVHGCAPVFPHQALAKVHTQCTDDAAVAKRVASLRGGSSGGYFYTHDEMVTTMVQKVETAADQQTVLYFRIAFSDKSSGKGNVITSLRGIDEITPGCRSGRIVVRFPFVKDTLLRGLSVANVTLLGGAVGGVVWNMSDAGLNLDLDATSRMFGARLFGPSSLPVVLKV